MKRGLSLLALLTACASAPPPIAIESPFWFGQDLHSPALPGQPVDDTPALVLDVLPATGPAGPSLALFISARVPGAIAERYGGRLPEAIHVIAVNADQPWVYHGTASPPDAIPLSVAPARGPDDGATLSTIETWVNGDLGSLVGLPPEGGRYQLYAWLDELLAGPLSVTVPPNPNRVAHLAQPRELTPHAWSNAPESERLTLNATAERATLSGGPPDASVVVLSLCGPTRLLNWSPVSTPVDFDAQHLLGCTDPAGQEFLLALAPGEHAGPLRLPRSRP